MYLPGEEKGRQNILSPLVATLRGRSVYMHMSATPSRFTQQIVLTLNLGAEEIGLLPQRTDMKLSLTESGTAKIWWHSFKEQIKENTLNRKFHYST